MLFTEEEGKGLCHRLGVTMGKLCQQSKRDAMQNWLVPNVLVVRFSKNVVNPQINYLKEQQCCKTTV